MKQIAVDELCGRAKDYLREVEAGASFEVTDGGRAVALLIPAPSNGEQHEPGTKWLGDRLEHLIAEGRVKRGKGNLDEFLRKHPPLPHKPGLPLPSEVLEQMRADER